MTDVELKNLTNEPPVDNLSLENWALPKETKKPTEKEGTTKKDEKEEEESKKEKHCHGIKSLIPQYIQSICKKPKTAELRVSYDAPTQQSTYIYSIVWEVGDEEVSTESSQTPSTVQELSSQETYVNTPTKKGGGSPMEQDIRIAKCVSSQKIASVPPVTAKCDGPCKKEFPSNYLSTIGRCGHYLCSACYGIVKNDDGTSGCSSLQCFWKGASREESKKNYEKDVCRKQRKKALDLNARGADVKPASAASSSIELSPHSSKSVTNSETYLSLTVVPSYKKPSKVEPIRVKLILVEFHPVHGITHTYVQKSFDPDVKLSDALSKLLCRKHRSPEKYTPKANLYYGMMKDDERLGMRRIKNTTYEQVKMEEIPKLGDYVVLIMDMDDYVSKGVRIYLE